MKRIIWLWVVLGMLLELALATTTRGTLVAAERFGGLTGDKTFVVWATPANLTQRGGSVLTLDDGQGHFDGVVFGELAPARWMAGSDFFRRTNQQQDTVPRETVAASPGVQIALVYRGREISLFRNGELLSRHEVSATQAFGRDSVVLIGLRHLETKDGVCFAGAIDDARIYSTALTPSQLTALRPNALSKPPPIAWWNFENGQAEDVQGAFPPARLAGKARIESGQLMLDGQASYLITPPSATPKPPSAPPAATANGSADTALHFHLMHPGGASLPGDPNAAFHLDGTYHLHYILAHPWKGQTSFSFVHVTSPDMLHWTWQPTKLQPALTGHGMFSGTGFLTADGRPAAIYHGQGSGRNQIAMARDRQLSAWDRPFPVDVRHADGSEARINHWDPDCFRIGDTYYAISGGPQPPLFKSRDLRQWTLVGDFLRSQPDDVTIGEDISCPNFFRLGDRWMLLCISHPLGCRYYIGDWDERAEQFVPRQHGRMNWARPEQPVWGLFQRTDFFAPESVLTPDGRRVMWAWITSAGPENRLLNRTIQSLPRELSLGPDGTLRMRPLRELAGQRLAPQTLTDVVLSHPVTGHQSRVPPDNRPQLQRIADLPGDAAEMRVTISRSEAARKMCGLILFSDGRGGGLPIMLRPETGTLRVGTTEAPFAVASLPDGEDVELRIFVDRYLVEVFANDRQAILAAYFPPAGQLGVDAFTVGAPTTLGRIDIWPLRPTTEGFRKAQQERVWEPRTE
ncbi:MAG: GH32 C-terminal domain-containing protein [Pirellulales bacterium]